ncbi:MAG TPA: hypothetical protein VH497_06475 [Vicinamibacterales bacterium]|jgi:hypothetical protein
MANTLTLAPADLLLDEQNPRIEQPNAGQQRALQALAHHLDRKLLKLALDIVENGIDPSNLPIVLPVVGTPARYVVLEGNRRLAALKVLENPDTVSDAVKPTVLKALRRLSKTYQSNPIDTIECVVVRDRDAARHWIELRHTGLNEGAGIMPWGSDEAARYKSRTGASEIHSQALDFLQQRGDLTPEARRKVPATTLKRLIETPVVRAKIGIEKQDGRMALLADEKAVAKALMHIVNDLVSGKTKVGDVYTKPQRQKYADNLPSSVVVTPTAKPGHGVPPSGTSATTPRAKKPKRSTHRKRDRLISNDCVLNLTAGRIRDIEGELRRLSLEDHTNAVSVLFRVFLELSVDSYLDDNPQPGVDPDQAKLRVKVEKVATDLETKKKINKQQARAIRSASQGGHSFLAPNVNTMNDYIHNEYIFPSPSDLRAAWDSMQPFIAAIWTE